jgi:hypothetical protein
MNRTLLLSIAFACCCLIPLGIQAQSCPTSGGFATGTGAITAVTGDSSCFDRAFSHGDNVTLSGLIIGNIYTVSTCGEANPSNHPSPVNSYIGIWNAAGTVFVTEALGGSCGDGDDERVTFTAAATSHLVVLRTETCVSGFALHDLCILNEGPSAPAGPEMDVTGNGNSIADGDVSPSSTDHTNFGTIPECTGTIVRTFTITNFGTAILNLSGAPRVQVSGANAADFTVTTQPAATVAIAGSTTFQVTFDPSAVGIRNATLSIANDDADENPYDFAIRGSGSPDNIAPAITVCPSNQIGFVGASCNIQLPNFSGLATATDNCPGPITFTQSPSAGTTVSGAGTNITVSLVATDASMNSSSGTCSFTFTTQDTTSPTAVCQNISIQIGGSGIVSISASDVNGGSTDNCSLGAISASPTSFTCTELGLNNVTLTVNDGSGNQSTCVAVVTVQDTTSPDIICPGQQTGAVDANCQISLPDFTSLANSSDDCDPSPTVTQSPTIGSTISGAGTTTLITLTANDASGNTGTCTFNFVTEDTTAPSVTCPGNQTVIVDNNCQIVLADYRGMATIVDNCDPTPASFQNPPAGTTLTSTGVPQTIKIYGGDFSSNGDSCTLDIIFQDTTRPSITCPGNQTLVADANCSATLANYIAQTTAADNCDANPSIIQFPPSGATLLGTGSSINVTMTATDASSNAGTCSFQVTLQDQTAPNLVCPPNQNISANSNCQGIVPFFNPQLSDNCDAFPSLVQSPPGGTPVSGVGSTATVNLTATDASNNVSNCSVVVTVVDNTAPTMVCPSNQTVFVNANCSATLQDYSSQTNSTDNCSASVTVTQSPASGQTLTGGNNIQVTMMGTDGFNNSSSCSFTVIVQDTIRPTLTCPANQTLQANANCSATIADYRPMATTADNCTANPVLVQTPGSGTVVTSPGTQTLTITSTDGFSNSTSCTFTVTVQDTVSPTINCPAPQTLTLDANCQAAMTNYIPTTTSGDNCTTNPTVTQVPLPGTTISGSGSQLVTLTADDGNGNTSSCSITVTVFDLMAPVVTCPPAVNLIANPNCAGNIPSLTGGATVSDNCTAQNTLTQSPISGTAITGSGTITTVVLTAVDSAGNTDTCHVTVTLTDTISPVISGCPANVVITPTSLDCNPTATWTPPLATDACGTSLSGTHQPGDNFPVGVTTVTYTATDSSGNTAVCSFTVTVNSPQLDNVITVSDPNPCEGDTVTLTATLGSTFSWSTSATTSSITVTQSGTFWVDLTDASNCTGRDSVDVTFLPAPAPVIVQTGSDLCASATFTTYQWFLNGTLIPGATGNCFSPTASGNYTLVVTGSNGCEGESAVFMYVGTEEAMAAQGFEVFPNPTRDYITVRMEQPLLTAGEVVVYDLRGRVVIRSAFDRIDSSIRLDLSDITDGTYLLEIKSEGYNARTRVIRMR